MFDGGDETYEIWVKGTPPDIFYLYSSEGFPGINLL